MKIWKAELRDVDDGNMQVWDTSERGVRKLAMNEWSVKPTAVKQIEIPTTKAGLVEWLNANFSRDNG